MAKVKMRRSRKAWRVIGRYGHQKSKAATVYAPNAGVALFQFVMEYPEFWAKSWGETRLVARRIYGRV